jgi:hypothetical protein
MEKNTVLTYAERISAVCRTVLHGNPLPSVVLALLAAFPVLAQVTSVGTGCGLSGGPITLMGTIISSIPPSNQTGSSYSFVASACGTLVTFSNSGLIAATLPQPGSGSAILNGWFVDVQNRGAGALTITPASSTIDGAV